MIKALHGKVEHNKNIQTAVGEIIETHLEISFVRQRMVGDQLFDAASKRLQFLTRRVVGDLYKEALATRGTKAEVFDRRIDDRVVRN